jgi:histidinol-phosphate aminotransferase
MHPSSSRLHSQAGASTSNRGGGATTLTTTPSSTTRRLLCARRRRSPMAPTRASPAEATAPAAADCNGASASTQITAASLVRAHLRSMAPYTPIEPFEVLSARYGRTPDQIVKLDANENPYGPPPEVSKALGSMPYANIYPDPSSRALRKELARLNGVDERHLLVRFFVLVASLLSFVARGVAVWALLLRARARDRAI